MTALLYKLGMGMAVLGSIVGGWFGYHDPNVGTAAPVQPVAGSTYTLAGSGVSSSATSVTLQSLTITQTGQKLIDSDFSTTFYLTLEPGNRTKQEIVSCTTVTQNSGGTATLSGCSRGLAPIFPYTASTSLQFVHAGGTQVIFADPPQHFNQYAAKSNNELIPGAWTASTTNPWKYDGTLAFGSSTNQIPTAESIYKNFARSSEDTTISGTTTAGTNHGFVQHLAPTNGDDVVNLTYANNLSFAGVPNASQTTKGIVEEATVAEISASTAAGSAAQLYMNPAQFQYSNFASTTQFYVGTTTTRTYLAKTLVLSAGQVVMWDVNLLSGGTNIGALGYRISGPQQNSSTTLENDASGTSGEAYSFAGTFVATTTPTTITVDFTAGAVPTWMTMHVMVPATTSMYKNTF